MSSTGGVQVMKMRVVLPLAAICLARPAEAAPLLANETELHIETQGEVKAISATLSQTVHVAKRGKDYCDKEVAEKVAEVEAQLADLQERRVAAEARFEELDMQLADSQEREAQLGDKVIEAERKLTACREQQRTLERQAQEA
eukprot:gene17280-21837_t